MLLRAVTCGGFPSHNTPVGMLVLLCTCACIITPSRHVQAKDGQQQQQLSTLRRRGAAAAAAPAPAAGPPPSPSSLTEEFFPCYVDNFDLSSNVTFPLRVLVDLSDEKVHAHGRMDGPLVVYTGNEVATNDAGLCPWQPALSD